MTRIFVDGSAPYSVKNPEYCYTDSSGLIYRICSFHDGLISVLFGDTAEPDDDKSRTDFCIEDIPSLVKALSLAYKDATSESIKGI